MTAPKLPPVIAALVEAADHASALLHDLQDHPMMFRRCTEAGCVSGATAIAAVSRAFERGPEAHDSDVAGLHKPSGVVCGPATCVPLYSLRVDSGEENEKETNK